MSITDKMIALLEDMVKDRDAEIGRLREYLSYCREQIGAKEAQIELLKWRLENLELKGPKNEE